MKPYIQLYFQFKLQVLFFFQKKKSKTSEVQKFSTLKSCLLMEGTHTHISFFTRSSLYKIYTTYTCHVGRILTGQTLILPVSKQRAHLYTTECITFVACVAAGPRTRLNPLYSIYRRFRASATQAKHLQVHEVYCTVLCIYLVPNMLQG